MNIAVSGTLGDTFVNVIKLWNISKTKDLFLKHYTRHPSYHNGILDIYSMIKCTVEFTNSRSTHLPQVHSHFYNVVDSIPLKETPFPEFDFSEVGCMRSNGHYTCISPRSGRPDQKRFIGPETLDGIMKDSERVIIIGTDKPEISYEPHVTDMRGKTSLLESFNVIRHCKEFHGFQGVHCLVALSMKIPTYIYVREDFEEGSIRSRIHWAWEEYLMDIKRIK